MKEGPFLCSPIGDLRPAMVDLEKAVAEIYRLRSALYEISTGIDKDNMKSNFPREVARDALGAPSLEEIYRLPQRAV